jgi:hypothetical protein
MRSVLTIIFALVSATITFDFCLARSGGSSGSAKTITVRGYTRSDGTNVNSYSRAAPGAKATSSSLSSGVGSPATQVITKQADEVSTSANNSDEIIDLTPRPPPKRATVPPPPEKFSLCYMTPSGKCVLVPENDRAW